TGAQRVTGVRDPQCVETQGGHPVDLPAPRRGWVGPQPVERAVVGLHAEPVDAGEPHGGTGRIDNSTSIGSQVAGAGTGGHRRGWGEGESDEDGGRGRGDGGQPASQTQSSGRHARAPFEAQSTGVVPLRCGWSRSPEAWTVEPLGRGPYLHGL